MDEMEDTENINKQKDMEEWNKQRKKRMTEKIKKKRKKTILKIIHSRWVPRHRLMGRKLKKLECCKEFHFHWVLTSCYTVQDYDTLNKYT